MDVHFQYSNNRASVPNIQAVRHLFTVFKYFKYSNNCVFIPSIQVSVHVFPYFLWIYFHWRGYRQNLLWKTGGKVLFSCILEKQPSIGVIRKEWSENILQIYRLTPMEKCDLPKSHFVMGVLLQIWCIFSEDFFLRTPLEGCICILFVFNFARRFIKPFTSEDLLSSNSGTMQKHWPS